MRQNGISINKYRVENPSSLARLPIQFAVCKCNCRLQLARTKKMNTKMKNRTIGLQWQRERRINIAIFVIGTSDEFKIASHNNKKRYTWTIPQYNGSKYSILYVLTSIHSNNFIHLSFIFLRRNRFHRPIPPKREMDHRFQNITCVPYNTTNAKSSFF